MKKNLLIASIAGVTALSGIVALTSTNSVQAANETLSASSAKTKLQNVMKKRQKATFGTTQDFQGNWSGTTQGQWHGKKGEGMMWFGLGGGMWIGMGWHFTDDSDMWKAIAANDYNAFVKAFNADTHKPSDATAPTQEQFNKMVTQYKKQKAIDAAIEANDYNAFVSATTVSKEEFATIVARHTAQKAIKTAVDNKDYNAFVAALKADTNRPSDATIPTQEEFNKMIENKGQRQQQRADAQQAK